MEKYTDNEWLENIARQYEIATVAHEAMMNCVTSDLARRTGLDAARIAHVLEMLPEDDVRRPWLDDAYDLRRRVQDVMGDEFERVRARLDLFMQASQGCAADLARHRGDSREVWDEQLCEFACERGKGCAESFATWLRREAARAEEVRAEIDTLTNLYFLAKRRDRKHWEAKVDTVREIARLLIIEPEHAKALLDAFMGEPGQTDRFAAWALRQLQATQTAAE
jgi:hypothetical protein